MDFVTTAALVSAGLNYIGGRETNAANAEQAANQMAFQERMSGSAHQREMRDLEAAGLNPLLSARYAGSSTPVGAMGHMVNPVSSAVQAGMDVYRGGLEGRRNPSVIDLNRASADAKVQEGGMHSAMHNLLQQQVSSERERTWLIAMEQVEVGTRAVLNQASSVRAEADVQKIRKEVDLLVEDIKSARKRGEVDSSEFALWMEYLSKIPGLGHLIGGIGAGLGFGLSRPAQPDNRRK